MRIFRWAGIYTLCASVLLIVRIGLWVTKYQFLCRLLVKPSPRDPQPDRIATVARIVHAVERTARLVPDASCLTQTIAGQAMLSWKRIPSIITIGLRKDDQGALQAHAWLVWNGKVVLQGNDDISRSFKTILDLPTPVAEDPAS